MYRSTVCMLFLWISLGGISHHNWKYGVHAEKSRSKRAPTSWLSSTKFSAAQIQYIVDQHNLKRRSVKPESGDMRLISWDEELASKAADHSKKCTFDHGGAGENIYTTGSRDVDAIVKRFVEDWYKESENYDFAKNECESEKICNHYTQLVWAKSYAVGCGLSQCSEIEGLGLAGTVLVCNYQDAGNSVTMVNGVLNALRPYSEGTSCSQCDEGLQCISGLCGKIDVLGAGPATTASPSNALDHAKTTSSAEADLCYRQNKKIIDTWTEQMRQWRDVDMTRWRRSMERYEEFMDATVP